MYSPASSTRRHSPTPEAIVNTSLISSRLQFTLEDLGYEFPHFPLSPGETIESLLWRLTDEGARRRYTPYHEKARQHIEHELSLINRLKLGGCFLIVWDIVRFCREKGILCQGRGSAANSAVCYALGITAVDPVGMGLLFERFLSENRDEWPDIDIDLPSGDEREMAIQYVYDRYGAHGAAMTASVITYRGKLAAREAGKVLGFDGNTLNTVSSLAPMWGWKNPDHTTISCARPVWIFPTQKSEAFSISQLRFKTCPATWDSIRAAWWSARVNSTAWLLWSLRRCRTA